MTSFSHIRRHHFARLDEQRQVYLDYTGSALYPSTLVDQHHATLSATVAGNPHSSNPPSQLSTARVDAARAHLLSFFRADPRVYTVIFTQNASNAIKLVAESFPFVQGSSLLLSADNHNSVLAIREHAKRASASVSYLALTSSLRLHQTVDAELASSHHRPAEFPSLFAYPAQSNFSGVKHPLSLIRTARAHKWVTLLDAAAFAPSSPLDLSSVQPDFVPISFYKLLGFPTGVGALIARRDALARLQRPAFAGGTVSYASVFADTHTLIPGHQGFEDGTPNFLALAAVPAALHYLSHVGMPRLRDHVEALTSRLLHGLLAARWPCGARRVVIHGPRNMRARGGTVAFDLVHANGARVDARKFEAAATAHGIAIRIGCFCNPGAAERALGVRRRDVEKCVAKLGDGATNPDVAACLGVGFLGCIRVSVGLANNKADVDKLLAVLTEFCNGLPSLCKHERA